MLTKKELQEAYGLCTIIMKRDGVSSFTSNCQSAAKNGGLTIKQLKALRIKVKDKTEYKKAAHKSLNAHPKSKRPISLALITMKEIED
jgi:hypothetical protein